MGLPIGWETYVTINYRSYWIHGVHGRRSPCPTFARRVPMSVRSRRDRIDSSNPPAKIQEAGVEYKQYHLRNLSFCELLVLTLLRLLAGDLSELRGEPLYKDDECIKHPE